MTDLVTRRARVAGDLADDLRAVGDTSAARRELWARTIQNLAFSGENITTQRTQADVTVAHFDSEIEKLKGEIEALRVELGQIDFEATHKEA